MVCSPGLDPDCFFDWLSAYSPTWYSAVPTMHQIILEHASSKDLHLEHSTLALEGLIRTLRKMDEFQALDARRPGDTARWLRARHDQDI